MQADEAQFVAFIHRVHAIQMGISEPGTAQAELQRLAGLMDGLWPMQAHHPKPMPRRWDVLQHVQQRQPVACTTHAGPLPKLMHPHRWPGSPLCACSAWC